MLVIGLVGEIGAGKSEVARRFEELGTEVIDADAVGHEVLDRTEVIEELLGHFGQEIADSDGKIDRRSLATVVFGDTEQRCRLEKVVHPAMREIFERRIREARQQAGSLLVVLDAALLFEADWNDLCDRTIFVGAPREHRIGRLQAQRGWSSEELLRREAAQLPVDTKRSRADVLVSNDSSLDKLWERVDRLFLQWTKPAACSRPSQSNVEETCSHISSG